MESHEIAISKVGSIHFAERNSLMPNFDNRLTYEEWHYNYVIRQFSHRFFQNDKPLIQVLAALDAVVTVSKFDADGNETSITLTDTTTYPTFMTLDYLPVLSDIECVYFEVYESGTLKYKSENCNVTIEDTTLKLLQWTNFDLNSNGYQFDYQTTAAKANVNFMRVNTMLFEYSQSGETTVYDNQGFTEIVKANRYRNLNLKVDVLPVQIGEIVGLAIAHDNFQVNEVAFVAEKEGDFDAFGVATQFTATLKQPYILGINTHDTGFNCDEITENMRVRPLSKIDAAGTGQFAVSAGFAITNIILMPYAGITPRIKIGSTVGNNDILRDFSVPNSAPLKPKVMTREFTPNSDAAWNIYYEVLAGRMDVHITTVVFNLNS